MTVKFETVTVCVITTMSVKGSWVATPEQRGIKVLIPVPAKDPEGSEMSPGGKPKEGRTSWEPESVEFRELWLLIEVADIPVVPLDEVRDAEGLEELLPP